MSLPALNALGLSSTEATLYELLLKRGEVPASELISASHLKRPTVYKALYSLVRKGLVEQKDIHKKIHFRPESPTHLLEQVESRYQEVSQTRNMLQTVIPSLLSDYNLSVERPVVQIYEGVEGMKKAHRAILEEKKPIDAYVMINQELDKSLDSFWAEYYRIRKRDGIFARVICPNTQGALEYKKYDAEELRETRLIPYGKFDIHIEKNICGNKVAFFSSEGGKLFSTIIENEFIATTERAIFELAWEQAKHFDEFLAKPSPNQTDA